MTHEKCSQRLFHTARTRKKGFTLVELVIVIAVLAIIAAIAIPTVSGVVKNANDAADAANCRQIGVVLRTFQSEMEASDTIPPSYGTLPSSRFLTIKMVFAFYGTTFPDNPKSDTAKFFAWDMKKGLAVLKTQAEIDADKKTFVKLGADTLFMDITAPY